MESDRYTFQPLTAPDSKERASVQELSTPVSVETSLINAQSFPAQINSNMETKAQSSKGLVTYLSTESFQEFSTPVSKETSRIKSRTLPAQNTGKAQGKYQNSKRSTTSTSKEASRSVSQTSLLTSSQTGSRTRSQTDLQTNHQECSQTDNPSSSQICSRNGSQTGSQTGLLTSSQMGSRTSAPTGSQTGSRTISQTVSITGSQTNSRTQSARIPSDTSPHAIHVLGWAEFVAHPSRLHDTFSRTKGGDLNFDPRLVVDLTESTYVDDVQITVQKDNIVFHTSTAAQLTTIHNLFFRRLLLLKITIYHTEISARYSVETVSIVEDDFAVLVNAHHPSVNPQMKSAFHSSMAYMKNQKNFCLEFDLSDLFLDWYMEVRDAITSCDDIHSVKSRRARLSVTNHTLYKHNLDCSPKWIVFLCLCWILTVPCYRIFRKLTCADIHVKLKCDVTSASHYIYNETTCVQLSGNQPRYDTV